MDSRAGTSDADQGAPLEPVHEAPPLDQIQAALAAVLQSTTFRSSRQSQHLLQYLVDQTLAGHDEMLKERIVGANVFDRDIGYDTGADPIVRVRAADLRKRLAQYYTGEGAGSTIKIEIHPGSYRPVFIAETQRQDLDLPPHSAADAGASQTPVTPSVDTVAAPREHHIVADAVQIDPDLQRAQARIRWMRAALAGAGLAIVLLAAGCIGLWTRIQSTNRLLYPWKYEPSVEAFWSGFLRSDQGTDIVVSDASFSLVQSLSKRQISLADYQSRSYSDKFRDQSAEMASSLNQISDWNLGSPDEYKLVLRLMALDPVKNSIHVYNARDFMPDLIKQHNVILIGSRISNPWAGLFEGRMNFIFGYGSMSEIENRSPAAGEQKTYSWIGSGSGTYGYSIVAYLPNPDHNGNVLLMEGGGPENTQAAGDFLLSEYQLSNFQKMLHVKTLPYFELLLKTSWVKGTPISTTIEAYRTYPNLH
jgi:hypothetical protein